MFGGVVSMERFVGIWTNDYDDKQITCELVVDNNKVEFFARNFHHERKTVFKSENINGSYFTVITNRIAHDYHNKTMEDSFAYNVCYVVVCKNKLEDVSNIQISKLKFSFDELDDWLNCNTIKINNDENGRDYISSENYDNIILQSEPKIEIKSIPFIYNESRGSRYITSVVMSNEPHISISYDNPVDVYETFNDIVILIQFFSMLIGKISSVSDITIELTNDYLCYLFFNHDFSYNVRAVEVYHKNRINCADIVSTIKSNFAQWKTFYTNNKYDILRLTYFDLNKNRQYIAEDTFIAYVRILEGYHIRESDDEETINKINGAQELLAKAVSDIIQNDHEKSIIKTVFSQIIPDYEINNKHLSEISKWIARGYISKKSLETRIKELDNCYFEIVKKNSDNIKRTIENPPEIFDLYHWIGATRNYYAHYKNDKKDVMGYVSMCNTINILKALATMIILDKMGISKDTIKQMMINDFELVFQTSCLKE